jgi:hypothetical protein
MKKQVLLSKEDFEMKQLVSETLWYSQPANLELLGRLLMEEYDYTLAQFLPVLEKPWKWEFEFDEAKKKYEV